jgi:hypothetical protein
LRSISTPSLTSLSWLWECVCTPHLANLMIKQKRAETKIGQVLRGLKVWRFMDNTTIHDNRKPRGHHEKCERRKEIQHLPFPFIPWFWFLRWHTKDKWNQQDQISCRWEQLQKQLLSILTSCKILNTLYIESQENELIIMSPLESLWLQREKPMRLQTNFTKTVWR